MGFSLGSKTPGAQLYRAAEPLDASPQARPPDWRKEIDRVGIRQHDRVLPFFEEHEIVLSRVLTAIGERSTVGATAMNTNYTWRFYRVAFRKKIYKTLEELQTDLEAWLKRYNEERPHQGRWCYGKTPMQTFVDSIPLAKETMIAA